jgi:ribosome-associated protein
MNLKKEQLLLILREVNFKTALSGGKGGQNVNKVATKVELYFHVANSQILSELQKQLLLEKHQNKISEAGLLKLIAQSERTQLGNKNVVIKKFIKLLHKSFEIKKKRIATLPSKKMKENRLKAKKHQTQKIADRKIDY